MTDFKELQLQEIQYATALVIRKISLRQNMKEYKNFALHLTDGTIDDNDVLVFNKSMRSAMHNILYFKLPNNNNLMIETKREIVNRNTIVGTRKQSKYDILFNGKSIVPEDDEYTTREEVIPDLIFYNITNDIKQRVSIKDISVFFVVLTNSASIDLDRYRGDASFLFMIIEDNLYVTTILDDNGRYERLADTIEIDNNIDLQSKAVKDKEMEVMLSNFTGGDIKLTHFALSEENIKPIQFSKLSSLKENVSK